MTRPLFFVLRERSTKRLMPTDRVATRAEFDAPGPPRLFVSRQAAKQALNCWRMGHWRLEINSYGESEGPQPPDPSKQWNAVTIALRKDVVIDIIGVRLVPELPTRTNTGQRDSRHLGETTQRN